MVSANMVLIRSLSADIFVVAGFLGGTFLHLIPCFLVCLFAGAKRSKELSNYSAVYLCVADIHLVSFLNRKSDLIGANRFEFVFMQTGFLSKLTDLRTVSQLSWLSEVSSLKIIFFS